MPTDSLDEMTTDTAVKTSDRELTMARQLIDSLSSDFEPEKYHDTYRQAVLELIDRKADGEEAPVPAPADDRDDTVVDLMAALEASVAAAKKSRRPKDVEAEDQPAAESA